MRVRGEVQGVGFRPYVFRLARELALTGWVMNDGHGVKIEVQGSRLPLGRFVDGLRRGPNASARVEAVDVSRLGVEPEHDFLIRSSRRTEITATVAVDTGVCEECLREVFDPSDRRYRYAFTSCASCGPRYTITARLPFDRSRTSMAAFPLCEACEREYSDPLDRRFHAEANACTVCGPALELLDSEGRSLDVTDIVGASVKRLREGQILAVKGLGGFHLTCDARNPQAVARLRERKGRETKPLALMALNTVSIASWASIDRSAELLLVSPERPIVLVPKRPACDQCFHGVAPGVGFAGVMLPYTALHYMLFHEAARRPVAAHWRHEAHALVLVMTSANPSGEPLVVRNAEALQRLRGVADAFIVHDRDILGRCDDSVIQARPGGGVLVRRGRGQAPRPLTLPRSGPSVLALGGELKSTACVTRGNQAYLTAHVGDLGNVAAVRALEEAVARTLAMLDLRPELIAHDLHPDFASTRLAARLAEEWGRPSVGVQHHHAHIAAVAAEHGLTGPVLGVALDGFGLGTDDGLWGGELLRVDAGFERLGCLRPLLLPGGDRAAREPWRMAASVLHALGRAEEIEARYPGESGRVLRQMLERGLNCPPSSSAGRLFDAAAALLGVRQRNGYEAQAAMETEALARAHGVVTPLSAGYRIDADNRLDLLPLLEQLAEIHDTERGAALFHASLALALADWADYTARAEGLSRIVLAGGCFLNGLLCSELRARLIARHYRVYEASRVPPNDGGLSLGQAWAAMMLETGRR
jgi:hydrogenase maturation protein HypF